MDARSLAQAGPDWPTVSIAGTYTRTGSSRCNRAASKLGYDLPALHASNTGRSFLELFHHIVAMDMSNLSELLHFCEPEQWKKPQLVMSHRCQNKADEAPVPYGGWLQDLECATGKLLIIMQQCFQRSGVIP